MRKAKKEFSDSGGRELDINDALRGLAYWGHYQLHSNYSVNYRQIEKGSFKMVKGIADEIGLRVDPPAIIEKWIQITPPKSGFDPVTLLYANHITK